MAGYFELKERGSGIRQEVIAGVTTFLTMAYIVLVNPAILSTTGMDKQSLVVVTCVVTAAATIAVGLVAKAPIAMAPGMGLNAFFAYLVNSGQMGWRQALGVVFLSGLLFLVLTLAGLRRKIVEAIPGSIVSAIAVGIGLFITFIGLRHLGVVVADEHTLVTAGPMTKTVAIGLAGLLVMIFFEMKKLKGGLLLGILAATLIAVLTGQESSIEQWKTGGIGMGAVSFELDILGALKWSFFGSIFALMFMDMFDSVGTLIACCRQAGMVEKDGEIRRLDRLLGIDAVATMFGAVMGTSTTTAYVESAAGIEQGGRTGLTSVVTGLMFLAAVVVAPVAKIVPEYATAPALIMVGLFMMKEIKRIDFGRIEEGFPAFIIMVMIALSYSISTGLAFGFVSFVIIKVVSGKVREVKAAMWIIAVLSVLFLTLERVRELVEYIRDSVG